MRILFLGNSFTYYHDLPALASHFTGWETHSVTRGGAFLHDFLNPEDELSARCEAALQNGKWDYVVLQEQSFNAVGRQADFLSSVHALCEKVKAIGAKPVLYCSWAYRDGGPCLQRVGITYEQMTNALLESYSLAAEENGAQLAPVGPSFARLQGQYELYDPDTLHPSLHGSYLAAGVICRSIAKNVPLAAFIPEGMDDESAKALRTAAENA